MTQNFIFEYEIPPMRAIMTAECDAEQIESAILSFVTNIPRGRIRSINGVNTEHTEELIRFRPRDKNGAGVVIRTFGVDSMAQAHGVSAQPDEG